MWYIARLAIVFVIGLSIFSDALAAGRGSGMAKRRRVEAMIATCLRETPPTSEHGYVVEGIADARVLILTSSTPIRGRSQLLPSTYRTSESACREAALRKANVEEASAYLFPHRIGLGYLWSSLPLLALAGLTMVLLLRRKGPA